MGCYAYCNQCNASLSPPTLSDAIVGKMRCPQCDSEDARDLDDFEKRMVADDLSETIAKICLALAVRAESHGLDRSTWDALAERYKDVLP